MVCETDVVKGPLERVPRVEGLDRETGHWFRHRLICRRVKYELCALAKECDGRPCDDDEAGEAQDEHEQLPHLGQCQRPVARIGLGKERMRVGLIPDVERAVEIIRGQREEGEFNEAMHEEEHGDCVCSQFVAVRHVHHHIGDNEKELRED